MFVNNPGSIFATAGRVLTEFAFQIAEREPTLKSKIETASEKLAGVGQVKRGLILYAIASQPNLQRNIPTQSEGAPREKMEFLLNLKTSADKLTYSEMIEALGLLKKKKK